jgi:hypothetical protein
MTVLVIHALLLRINFEHVILTSVLIIFVFYYPVKHVYELYIFSLIEIDNNFLVLTQPFQRRSVYTLNQITSVKPFFKSVFFLHNRFPVLINIQTLTERERKQLLKIITTSSKTSQHHNVDTVC